jgi:hypothetical protein
MDGGITWKALRGKQYKITYAIISTILIHSKSGGPNKADKRDG